MRIYFKIVFFTIMTYSSIAQAVIVEYRYMHKFDPIAKVVMNEKDNNLVDIEAILDLVKSSYIQYKLSATKDLVRFEYMEKDNRESENAFPVNILNKVIALYIDRKKNKFFCEEEFFDENFYISDTIINNNWNITPRDTVINSYLCKIATIEESPNKFIFAYYTEEIPISAGPYIYNDLPGIIIKVENDKWVYEAESIQFKDKVDIVPPEKSGKKIKYAEFIELKKRRFNGK